MKKIVMLLLISTMLFGIVGCAKTQEGNNQKEDGQSSNDNSKKDDDEKKEDVKFSFWYSAAEGDENDVVYRFHQENIELFQELHPNVEIEVYVLGGSGGTDYKTKLVTEAAAGNIPDIFMTWHGSVTEPMVSAGLLMPLDDIVKNDPELNETVDYSKLALTTYDGVLYGLPDTVDAIGYFYNKAIFEENELVLPTTYEELLETGQLLIDKGITPIGLGNASNWLGSLTWQFIFMQEHGYERYAKDILTGDYDLTNEDYVKALEETAGLAEMGMFGEHFNSIDANEAKAKFLAGESALFVNGSWATAGLYKELGDNLGFMTLPSKNGKDPAYMLGASKGFSLSADAPEEAVEFFKFIYSKERQSKYAEMGVFVSGKNIEYDESKLPNVMNDITNQLNESKNTFVIWGDILSQGVITDLWPAIQAVLEGADAGELLKNVQDIKELDN